ncbi:MULTISPECIES: hypothetical protein [Clostridium]|uniref:Uncharacterized protein n=1 Tax=Clostridium paraputrificum TaxID=29363 RepID=A0A1B8RLI6_9CLOT|nr:MULTISPECIES: hypothetical protein [Clostridium]MDB2104697.1 hypothetical protein [Clostridium paraputrificum]MDU1825546.1 hypothetical protein [Clostridium sp.]MDU1843477.1 hypothetical protein [Clostridium sp.]MDU2692283.1 hypothetical protein [Clostridium sp.]MDU2958567.1 hypothetical protein [Clostridium sp.]
MNKLDKNKVTFYCLLFGIMLVGVICLTFVIKNSFITGKRVCNDLRDKVIYIRDKEYILDNEVTFKFNIESVKEIESYKLREIQGVLTIQEDEIEYEVNMKIKYLKSEDKWDILNIIYDSTNIKGNSLNTIPYSIT